MTHTCATTGLRNNWYTPLTHLATPRRRSLTRGLTNSQPHDHTASTYNWTWLTSTHDCSTWHVSRPNLAQLHYLRIVLACTTCHIRDLDTPGLVLTIWSLKNDVHWNNAALFARDPTLVFVSPYFCLNKTPCKTLMHAALLNYYSWTYTRNSPPQRNLRCSTWTHATYQYADRNFDELSNLTTLWNNGLQRERARINKILQCDSHMFGPHDGKMHVLQTRIEYAHQNPRHSRGWVCLGYYWLLNFKNGKHWCFYHDTDCIEHLHKLLLHYTHWHWPGYYALIYFLATPLWFTTLFLQKRTFNTLKRWYPFMDTLTWH